MYWILLCFVTLASGKVLKNNDVTMEPDSGVVTADEMQLHGNGSLVFLPDKKPVLFRLPFAGSGCNCQNRKCTCCASIFVQSLDFDRNACAQLDLSNPIANFAAIVNTTYIEPTTTSTTTELPKTKSSFTAKKEDASKLSCVNLDRLSIMQWCAQVYNLKLNGSKMNVCVNMLTFWRNKSIHIMKLNCMDLDISDSLPENSSNAHQIAEEVIQPRITFTVTDNKKTKH